MLGPEYLYVVSRLKNQAVDEHKAATIQHNKFFRGDQVQAYCENVDKAKLGEVFTARPCKRALAPSVPMLLARKLHHQNVSVSVNVQLNHKQSHAECNYNSTAAHKQCMNPIICIPCKYSSKTHNAHLAL